jgi:hypothetical protein
MVAAGQWRNLSSSCRRRIARRGRDRRWMRSVRTEDYGQTVMKTGSEKPDRADGASSASKRVGSGPQTSIMARGISAASEAGHTSAPDRMHMSYPKKPLASRGASTHVRLRPCFAGCGRKTSSATHSSSVRSLGYRFVFFSMATIRPHVAVFHIHSLNHDYTTASSNYQTAS